MKEILSKAVKLLTFAMLITVLADTNKAYADDSLKKSIEVRGYYYFDTEEEAYEFIEEYVNKIPGHSMFLTDYMIKVAYSGEPSDRIINNLVYDNLDLISYQGNRIFDSVKEASTQRIIQQTNDDYLNQLGVTGYQVCNKWRTRQQQNEKLSEDEFYSAYNIAEQLANEFNYGTDYEKAESIYEYICNNISYDYSDTKASMWSALGENNSICTGFADSFYQICKDMGLNVYIINSVSHAYDIIELDGEYYIADLTQDCGRSPSNYQAMFIGTDNSFYINNPDRFGDNSTIGIEISSEDYSPYNYINTKEEADEIYTPVEEITYTEKESEETDMNKVDDSELVDETVGSVGMTDEEIIDKVSKEAEAEHVKEMTEEAPGVSTMFSKWKKERQRGKIIACSLGIVSGLALASCIIIAIKNKLEKN